ncbi:MAG: DUF4230 domain-containing protein [Phycisphaerales bacterium]
MGDLFTVFVLLAGVFCLGGLVFFLVMRFFRSGAHKPQTTTDLRLITERVRAVGKLVGLEVHAKEIATAKRGWSWIPPILLTQAKLAMIFQFEKQYSVELGVVTQDHVEELGGGRYRLTLPPIQGSLRLVDVVPYDIQQGRVLGLLDVIAMNADRQGELMKVAQQQAAELFDRSDERYTAQAREAVERQLRSLLALFDVDLDIIWSEPRTHEQPRVVLDQDTRVTS